MNPHLAEAMADLARGEVSSARARLAEVRVEDLPPRERALATAMFEECSFAPTSTDAPSLVAGSQADAPGDGEDEESLDEPRVQAGTSRTLARDWLRWFGGRRDLYSVQWYDERRKRGGYRPVFRPLTEEVARQHLEGAVTVGQYLLDSRGGSHFGVIDLDLRGSARALWETEHPGVPCFRHGSLAAFAMRVVDLARRLGIPLFAEDSGSKGLHLWLFVEPVRPASAVRAVLSSLVQAAGSPGPDVGVEVFPKQDRSGPRGLSSLVKLPLGVHRATLRPCPLLDDRLEALPDSALALARLQCASNEALDAVLGKRVMLLPSPETAPVEPLPELPKAPTAAVLSEMLRAVEGGRVERERAEAVLERCPPLRALVDSALEKHTLAPAEARAVAYTLGLLGPRGEVAREVFAEAGASFRELDRLRTGLPSPMGCAKLRGLASGCVGCFEHPLPYATPMLHAMGPCAPSAPTHAAYGDALAGPIAEDPITTLASMLRRIEERIESLASAPSAPGAAGKGHDADGVPHT